MFALTHNFADSAWGSVLVTSWTFNTKPLRLPVSADRGGLHPMASRGGVPPLTEAACIPWPPAVACRAF